MKTCGVIEEDVDAGIQKVAEPVGVICGVVPTTNPGETAIFKSLIALKTRNAIVFSPHPRAVKSTCDAAPTPICPFVSVCADGSLTVLRDDAADALTCSYEACSLAGAPANTAQMAAPAVILLTVLIVFVEALINFC